MSSDDASNVGGRCSDVSSPGAGAWSVFDPSIAHPARVCNTWLGGKDNYGADRDAAALVVRHRPQAVAGARENRRFLARAVRYAAGRHGIRQFLDIGAGLPAPGNTHEVAQQADARSRVVYVDKDPVVLGHIRALLTSTAEGSCEYLQADLRDSSCILESAARTLDLALPVAVLLLAVLHFVPDADDPAGAVAELAGALAPGSCVVVSHLTADFAPEAVSDGVRAYNRLVPTPVFPRSHAQVSGLFAGLSAVAPGVVPIGEWRADGPARPVTDLYGGVACKVTRHW